MELNIPQLNVNAINCLTQSDDNTRDGKSREERSVSFPLLDISVCENKAQFTSQVFVFLNITMSDSFT